MKSTVEILEGARERLARPKGWVRYAMAACGQNAFDANVSTLSPEANCFCAYGACLAAAGVDNWASSFPLRKASDEDWVRCLVDALPSGQHKADTPFETIANYNDRWQTSLEDVIEWFDRAIALARDLEMRLEMRLETRAQEAEEGPEAGSRGKEVFA